MIFRADLAALLAFKIGIGELIYLIGCASHAVYVPLVRMLNRGESPLVFAFGTLIGGSILLIAYGWPALQATEWAALPMVVWVTLGYITVFATAVTFVLVQYASLRLPGAKVMAYTYLVPSWVMLWEVTMGNGVPSGMILIGVALTVVALVMLLREEA